MKSKDRQEIFKDERTIQIEHKIGNDQIGKLIYLKLSLFLVQKFMLVYAVGNLAQILGVVIQLVVVEDSEVVWLQEYSQQLPSYLFKF